MRGLDSLDRLTACTGQPDKSERVRVCGLDTLLLVQLNAELKETQPPPFRPSLLLPEREGMGRTLLDELKEIEGELTAPFGPQYHQSRTKRIETG